MSKRQTCNDILNLWMQRITSITALRASASLVCEDASCTVEQRTLLRVKTSRVPRRSHDNKKSVATKARRSAKIKRDLTVLANTLAKIGSCSINEFANVSTVVHQPAESTE
jgi:hypothetical protein